MKKLQLKKTTIAALGKQEQHRIAGGGIPLTELCHTDFGTCPQTAVECTDTFLNSRNICQGGPAQTYNALCFHIIINPPTV